MCFIAGPEELEALETDVVTPKETDFTKKLQQIILCVMHGAIIII